MSFAQPRREIEMDGNTIRLNLAKRIGELGQARDRAGATDEEKAAARAAIKKLQDVCDAVDIGATDDFVGTVNKLIADLEKIRTSRNLDAVSALGVTIKKVRELTDD
jgi:hypothetical protein